MIKQWLCFFFGHQKKFVHRVKSEIKTNADVDCYRCYRCGELLHEEVIYDER